METTKQNVPTKVEECEHTYKLASSGWRHVETYKCTKCGKEKTHHWYKS